MRILKGLCSYYKIYECDFDFLERDLCDYGYPLSCIILCHIVKILLNHLLDKIERFEDYEIPTL